MGKAPLELRPFSNKERGEPGMNLQVRRKGKDGMSRKFKTTFSHSGGFSPGWLATQPQQEERGNPQGRRKGAKSRETEFFTEKRKKPGKYRHKNEKHRFYVF